MRRLRVLLDANVLVDAQVRDLFLTMGEAELIDLRWSAEILDETRRALVGRLGLDSDKVERLLAAVTRAFSGASIDGFEHLIDQLDLPDSDDRHVLAAAIHGECDLLVTYNEKDFPDELAAPGDVEVLTVDEAVFMLAGVFPASIGEVVRLQVERLKRPAMTVESFLDRLASRVPTGTIALGAALGIETYEQMFADIILSESSASAQSAVRELVRAVKDDDRSSVVALVDAEFAAELVGSQPPDPAALHSVLHDRLQDVFSTTGWRVATARRLQAPDVELVKLVQAGDEAVVAFEPQVVQGHLFYMKLTAEAWVMIGLDGPDPSVAEEE